MQDPLLTESLPRNNNLRLSRDRRMGMAEARAAQRAERALPPLEKGRMRQRTKAEHQKLPRDKVQMLDEYRCETSNLGWLGRKAPRGAQATPQSKPSMPHQKHQPKQARAVDALAAARLALAEEEGANNIKPADMERVNGLREQELSEPEQETLHSSIHIPGYRSQTPPPSPPQGLLKGSVLDEPNVQDELEDNKSALGSTSNNHRYNHNASIGSLDSRHSVRSGLGSVGSWAR